MTPTEARNLILSLNGGKHWTADDFTADKSPDYAGDIEEAMATLLNWAIEEIEE